MSQEKLCLLHGPYNASYGSCPRCAEEGRGGGQRPAAPPPLDQDDMPTELPGIGRGAAPAHRFDDQQTDLGQRGAGSGRFLDDPTILPQRPRHGGNIDETRLEFPETGLLGLLWVTKSQIVSRGRYYDIKDGTTIGRTEGQVLLNDDLVSSSHARFRVEDDKFVIGDLMSSNGTYVNGDKIRAATELNENDEIKIGSTVFVLKVLPE